jgi:hypothetical protein
VCAHLDEDGRAIRDASEELDAPLIVVVEEELIAAFRASREDASIEPRRAMRRFAVPFGGFRLFLLGMQRLPDIVRDVLVKGEIDVVHTCQEVARLMCWLHGGSFP